MRFDEALNLLNEEGPAPKVDANKNVIKDEKGRPVRGGKGLVVFDIDDNLLSADSSAIKIWKKENGKETPLSTDEFAKDPGKNPDGTWKPGVTYDYREFREPTKVRNSIVKGKPNMPVLKAMDNYINQGYDFCFLTARGLEDVVADSLKEFLRYRDSKTGKLKELGKVFKRDISYAVNDTKHDEKFKGYKDPQKKAAVLRELCKKYDVVKFFDDDKANCRECRALNIPNLYVVNTAKK